MIISTNFKVKSGRYARILIYQEGVPLFFRKKDGKEKMIIEITTEDLNKVLDWLEFAKYEYTKTSEEVDELIDRIKGGIK